MTALFRAAENGRQLCELVAAVQSLYCGHFASLEVGARQQQIVCTAGHLEFIDSASKKHSTADNSQLLFTCKVVSSCQCYRNSASMRAVTGCSLAQLQSCAWCIKSCTHTCSRTTSLHLTILIWQKCLLC